MIWIHITIEIELDKIGPWRVPFDVMGQGDFLQDNSGILSPLDRAKKNKGNLFIEIDRVN